MDIAIPLFDRFTALDADRPVRGAVPPARRRASRSSPPSRARCATDNGMLADRRRARARRTCPTRTSSSCPGGIGTRAMMRRRAHARLGAHARTRRPTWTTSVCTGSLVLGAAGLLDGLEATTHWMAMDDARIDSARTPTRPARGRAGQDHHRRRRVVRHRHGADARRAGSPATTSPRRSSSGSSTTRSRPSTRARPRRRPTRSSRSAATSRR